MDAAGYRHFLANLPLFRGLTPDELADLARVLRLERVAAGQEICREGGPADAAFVIASGTALVLKKTAQGDEQLLAELGAPTVVGEMALLDRGARSASVRMKVGGELYRLSCTDFDALRAQYSRGAAKLVKNLALILCERLRDTNDRINAFFADPERSLDEMRARQNRLSASRQRGS
jgi:CRP/FNR family transcriptional regulator, cyclic AMP receptor protein